AVAAVAGGAILDAHPVAANTQDNMILGRANFAQHMTRLNPGSGPFGVTDLLTTEKTLFWADNRTSGLADAVGVRGDGRDSGTGIDGYGGGGVRGKGTNTGLTGT